MAKVNDTLYVIKKDFLNGQKLTADEMKEKYNLSRASFFRYKALLLKEGFTLITDAKTGKLYHPDSKYGKDSIAYEPINANTIRQYAILSNLSHSVLGKTRKEILDFFSEKYYSGNETELNEEHINKYSEIKIKKSTFYPLINQMIEQGMLIPISDKSSPHPAQARNIKYRSNISLINLSIPNDDKLMDFIKLDDSSSALINNKALQSLKKKLLIMTGENLYTDDTLARYGRGNITYEKCKQYREELKLYHPDLNKIKFTYGKSQKSIYFSTGIIVYSLDKDALYLIGKHGHSIEIYDYSKLKDLEALNEKNEEYNSKIYLDMYTEMFSISSEKEVHHVEILFNNTPNNLNRLKQLIMNRKKATLIIDEHSILYKDSMSGIQDFYPYIRSFGDEYKILPTSSKKFINEMKSTIEKSLENYN